MMGLRMATLGVLAVMPTAVALVAPVGTSAAPQPVTPTVSEYALKDPRTVSPGAQFLSADAAAEARSAAGVPEVAVKAASAPVALPDGVSVVDVSWRRGSVDGASVQYRVTTNGAWGDWQSLEVDADHRPGPAEEAAVAEAGRERRDGAEPLVMLDDTTVQVRVIAAASAPSPADPQLKVIDPGTSPADATPGLAPGSATAASTRPQIYTRADWGANESLRLEGPGEGTVKAAFVHHTVHIDDPNDPNAVNEYTSDKVPGIIRGIYSAHLGRGYADVGYNFFIDRFGRTWEGRWGGVDRPVIGAHAYGVNDETFGAAVLGNFEIAAPPTAVLDAVTKLAAWKADVHGFNPGGTFVDTAGTVDTSDDVTYPAIEGHRAAKNNSTLCPGQYLYAKLPDIRKAAAAITDGSARPAERWSGVDRYATAAAVSAATFAGGAPNAFIATGSDFPDALAGGPAGATLGGPMLLTAQNSLPASTATELQRLKPQKIYVLGGSGVISDTVTQQLMSMATEVVRVGGLDRYATAADVSKLAFPTGAPIAFVATAGNFPDALAGGPAGAELGGPMLLTGPDALAPATAAELQRLAPSRIVVLGGAAVVSDEVASQIQAATGVQTERWEGIDRYATAAATSAKTFGNGSDIALVSTGSDFPDALAGGPSGGALGAPLLLTGRDVLPQATIDELKRLTPSRIIILGGPGVVSETVADQLRSYIVR